MAQVFKYGFKLDRPMPNKLAEGWDKPRVFKIDDHWVASVSGWLYHGQPVIIQGRHKDRDWAWALMVDHLVRHNILPTQP
jgi:hypothetical protein